MKRGVKEAILKALEENVEWHPTAKEIHEHLEKKLSGLAFSSVYRALEGLIKEKKIRSFKLDCEDERRFEIIGNPHVHFKCTKCGKVYDIDMGINIAFKELVEMHTDHIITDVHITYYGICKECFRKKVKEMIKENNV